MLSGYINRQSDKVFMLQKSPTVVKLSIHKLKKCSEFVQSLRVSVF